MGRGGGKELVQSTVRDDNLHPLAWIGEMWRLAGWTKVGSSSGLSSCQFSESKARKMSVIDWCQRVRALLCVGADIALISRGIVDSSVLEMMCWNVVAVKLYRARISTVLVTYPARRTSLSGIVVRRG